MMRDQGYFHSVETFGTVDGPGLRYVLFLSGCRLGCVFCHNRDTWDFGDKTIKVADVLEDYGKYRSFYDAAGGGITVSGGEPLLQPEFVASLFQACREQSIHTALDTAGFCPPGALERVLPYTDAVMFSLKAATQATHLKLTGQGNREIVENLRLAALTVPLIVRYVVIPGITDVAEELGALAELVGSLAGEAKVELLPYHQSGRHKWEQLAQPYLLPDVPSASAANVQLASAILGQWGIVVQGSPQDLL